MLASLVHLIKSLLLSFIRTARYLIKYREALFLLSVLLPHPNRRLAQQESGQAWIAEPAVLLHLPDIANPEVLLLELTAA